MPSYEQELSKNKFTGNVVLRFGGEYYAARRPDSGLDDLKATHERLLQSLVLNAATIDPTEVNTTIASYGFRMLDKNGIVSKAVRDTGKDLVGVDVEIWLGRTGVSMDFSEYYKLPVTRMGKINNMENSWNFTTRESTDRMNRPIFDSVVRLSGDILAGTTIISSKDDISNLAPSGYLQLEQEIISYASKNNTTKTFFGVARGEGGTIPDAHEDNVDMHHAELLAGNPLNILLWILCSGNGGQYDTLDDGLNFDEDLLDIAGIEALRDTAFADTFFSLAIYNESNALTWIETEILTPCGLRFTFSRDSKLTVSRLDDSRFQFQENVIDDDSIVSLPNSTVDDSSIQNEITVSWSYSEEKQAYLERTEFVDEESVDRYGRSASPLEYSFKGVHDQAFVNDFGNRLLARVSTPKPTIEVSTFISKSLLNLAERATLRTRKLPNDAGDLAFSSEMEILSRAINQQTGQVKFKLGYNSNTGFRLAYIAPASQFVGIDDQSSVTLANLEGDLWQAGWKVRLFNLVNQMYEPDAVNEISAVNADGIEFVRDWETPLNLNHMIRFANFDQVNPSQRRYAFVGLTGRDFSKAQKQYTIVP